MPRYCNAPHCRYPQFGGGFCKAHGYLRSDGKAPKPLKRTPLKYKPKNTGQKAVFDEILRERPLVSFLTGKPLSRIDFKNYSCMSHVLSKAKNKYPKFMLKKKNIVLLTYNQHRLFDSGTEKQRQDYAKEEAKKGITVDWEKLYDLRDELKAEYSKLDR